jgi:hypothetical protein
MSATAAPAAASRAAAADAPAAAQPGGAAPPAPPPPRLEALVGATRACQLQPAQFFCAWQAR